jgi:hypothetical protein
MISKDHGADESALEPSHTVHLESNACSNNDPVWRRPYVVQFYRVVPRSEGPAPYADGEFPLRMVVQRIQSLDPAADEYRFKETLFGNEHFCLIDESGPLPLFCAYTKDVTAAPETEKKGEIRSIIMDPDEGIVDAAYALVFPNDVVALVRTSTKAPGAAFLGSWLSAMSQIGFVLLPLPNLSVMDRVRGAHGLVRKFRLAGNVRRLNNIDAPRIGLAQELRSLARPGSDTVVLEQSNRNHRNRVSFAESVLGDIEEILDLLPLLQEANVWLTGQRRAIKLKGAHYTTEAPFGLNGHRRVTARFAAIGLMGAYEREREAIVHAEEQFRLHHARRRP